MFASASERVAVAERLATAIRPTAPASSRSLPVAEPLRCLLAGGALRRGTTVVVAGAPGRGATSLGLALLAEASASGHWCATVGLDDPGVVAMAELGVDLRRVVFVPRPRGAWAAADRRAARGRRRRARPPARTRRAHRGAPPARARARPRGRSSSCSCEHRDDWPVPAALDPRGDGGDVARRGAARRAPCRGPRGRPRRSPAALAVRRCGCPTPRGRVAAAR